MCSRGVGAIAPHTAARIVSQPVNTVLSPYCPPAGPHNAAQCLMTEGLDVTIEQPHLGIAAEWGPRTSQLQQKQGHDNSAICVLLLRL